MGVSTGLGVPKGKIRSTSPLSLKRFKSIGIATAKQDRSDLKNQGKTKGQQLKAKIVSHFFTLVRTFSHFFRNFSPRTFPPQNKGFQLNENKRETKIIKRTGQIDVAR